MKRIQKFMYNKYGMDELNVALLYFAMAFSLIGLFFNNIFFQVIFMYVPLIIFFFRLLSKNYSKRRSENDKFLFTFNPYIKKANKYVKRLKTMRQYKYLKCKNCHQELRVPRGRGKIEVTCSRCKNKFDAKS